jgi:hypothetical protein
MIWDPQLSSGAESAVAAHIADELAACGGMEDHAADLAYAVTCFLQDDLAEESVSGPALHQLVAQALSAVGEPHAARRVFLHGAGLVRPSEWTVTGRDAAWILDLRQMTVYADVSIELVLFRCLNSVVDSMADVWDETGGEGVLGLKHVAAAAGACASGSTAGTRNLAEEIKDICRGRLHRLRAARGWTHVPRVMNMEF